MRHQNAVTALSFFVLNSLASHFALATSQPSNNQAGRFDELCASLNALDLEVEAITFSNAVRTGNHQSARDILQSGNPELLDKLQLTTATPLFTAMFHGHAEVALALVEFAEHYPTYAEWIFALSTNGHTALRQAVAGGHAEIVRILFDFAETHPAHADRIFFALPNDLTLIEEAIQSGCIDIIRIILESPFYQRFVHVDRIRVPRTQDGTMAWATILEYIPDLAGSKSKFAQFGLLEAAVMALNIDKVQELLEEGAKLERGGELLRAMLRNSRSFDPQQFQIFEGVLRAQRNILHWQIPLNLVTEDVYDLAQAPPALREMIQTLDSVVTIARERLAPSLETMVFDSLGGRIRNLGQYGGPGRFRDEEQGFDVIRDMFELSALEFQSSHPGPRLFAASLAQVLKRHYFSIFGTFPGGSK